MFKHIETLEKLFSNSKFGNIRIEVGKDGEVLFCGKDICKALQYVDTDQAIRMHAKYPLKRWVPHPQSSTKQIEMVFITEPDLYRLIAHSRMPNAEEFEKWIYNNLIVTVRKYGGYITEEKLEEISNDEKSLSELLQQLHQEHNHRLSLEEEIEKLKAEKTVLMPYIEYAKNVMHAENAITIGEYAKQCYKTFKLGRNQLFDILRELKILQSGNYNNLPYQEYVNAGYLDVVQNYLNPQFNRFY